jgi:hypothetical protein
MLSVTWRDPSDLRTLLQETQERTPRTFGVNQVLTFDAAERLEICLDEGV